MVTRPALADQAEPVAQTRYGRLRGAPLANCLVFRGIRYATAARFMPPEPPAPWSGIRDAVAPGASAPQTNASPPPGPPYVILAQLPRPAGAKPPPPLPESEDCLFLNVWTPALRDGRKRPVLLWLHGGFFYGGTGSTMDGSGIAGRGDAVVVSINHRLNAFGYTHLADFAGGEFKSAGNAGMMDIAAALRWVRDNIEAFGGDPKRIMLFGSSGGGMKTSFLMASPPAKGLFSRAGVQSGPGLRFMERDDASAVTERLLKTLGLTSASAADLATISMERLLAGYHAVAAEMKPSRFIDLPCFAPVIDPAWLPRHPFSPDAAPGTADIPMLIGSNAQEMSFFWGNDPAAFTLDEAAMERRVEAFAGARSADIIAAYRRAYPPATPARLYLQLFSDYSVTLPAMAQADRHSAAGGRTYAYRLDYQSPALGGKLGALHTLESSLIFNTVDASRALLGPGPQPERLAHIMSGAWVRFAQTGDPSMSGDDPWPRYRGDRRSTLVLDDGARMVDDPSALARETMAELLKA
ncbi:carboxylesterase/lipase family protein [Sphingobium amiense]|uniref:Carboxylic ester hydrolase n=1 Tax=Sphingobium amiense TaxID=135719 RepID=A0A494W9Y3_9SPHN|nr:carboxylesterase family protein [Sphingobium amiense]BBD99968.1 carboxylesterase/lipase family protein [Sphingobium amiense]